MSGEFLTGKRVELRQAVADPHPAMGHRDRRGCGGWHRVFPGRLGLVFFC